MAFILIEMIVKRFYLNCPIVLSVDDTTCLRKGPKVYGSGKHRDAVRSSSSKLVNLIGHKWVVVCLNVSVENSKINWALRVAVGLYRSRETSASLGKRHKTAAHIARLLILKIQRKWKKWKKWKITVVGDQGYGQHRTAKMFSSPRSTLISKFYPNAVLHDLPEIRSPDRRKIKVGKRLPKPCDVVKETNL